MTKAINLNEIETIQVEKLVKRFRYLKKMIPKIYFNHGDISNITVEFDAIKSHLRTFHTDAYMNA